MPSTPLRVAVTGAAGYIGAGLVRRLEREASVESILAIDIRPPTPAFGEKITFLRRDVLSSLSSAFSENGITSVVHLAYIVKPGRQREAARRVNADGTASVLEACADAGVMNVLYLSSTTVYGAHADNPEMLTEGVTPRPLKGFAYSEDKLEAERLVQEFAQLNPEVTATIVRACPVLGPGAGSDIAQAFLKPFLVGALGDDPPMQFLHHDDDAEILARCVLNPTVGVFNAAGNETVRWSEVARILSRPMLRLPGVLLRAATDVAWAIRLQSDSTAVGTDLIRYPWTASTEKIRRELKVRFQYTSRQALESFAEHL